MPRYTRKILIFAVFFALLAAKPVLAGLPQPSGYVNDFANVLDSKTKNYLESAAAGFEKSTGNEIAVVTVNSLDGEPIENYAVDLFTKWGIGKKGKDNGLLILVAPNDREVRIEVGYGLEGIINDAQAGRIIRETMIPEFKSGNFAAGIAGGTLTSIALIAKSEGVQFDPASYGEVPVYGTQTKKAGAFETLISVFFFIIMIILFVKHPWLFLFFMTSGRSSGGRSGGFSGGSFGGFGGGMSGGGGASGRW